MQLVISVLTAQHNFTDGRPLQLDGKRPGVEMLTGKQEEVRMKLFLIVLKTNFHLSKHLSPLQTPTGRNLIKLKHRLPQIHSFEHSGNERQRRKYNVLVHKYIKININP